MIMKWWLYVLIGFGIWIIVMWIFFIVVLRFVVVFGGWMVCLWIVDV